MRHRRKPRFKLGQAVRICGVYTGKVVDREWIDDGWQYQIEGGNWWAEDALERYKKGAADESRISGSIGGKR